MSKKVAADFSTSVNYVVDDLVLYFGKLYRFTSNHSAGAWNYAHVTEVDFTAERAVEHIVNGYNSLLEAIYFEQNVVFEPALISGDDNNLSRDASYTDGYYRAYDSGLIIPNPSYSYTNFLPVAPGQKYQVVGVPLHSGNENLARNARYTNGYYRAYENGQIGQNDDYSYTDFIPIVPGSPCQITGVNPHNFAKNVAAGASYTDGAYRSYENGQVVQNADYCYTDYRQAIPGAQGQISGVNPHQFSYNLAMGANYTDGAYRSYDNGQVVQNPDYSYTDYIQAAPGASCQITGVNPHQFTSDLASGASYTDGAYRTYENGQVVQNPDYSYTNYIRAVPGSNCQITGVNPHQFSRNLASGASYTDGYYRAYENGQIGVNANYSYTNYIQCVPGAQCVIGNATSDVHVTFYNQNYNYVSGAVVNASKGWAFTIPAGAAYVVYSCLIANQSSISVTENYSITYDVHVTFYDSNQSYISGAVVNASKGWAFTVPSGTVYLVYSCGTSDKSLIGVIQNYSVTYEVHVTFYDGSHNYLSGAVINASKGWVFTVPSGTVYLVYSCGTSDKSAIGVLENYSYTYDVHVTFYDVNHDYVSGAVVNASKGWAFTVPSGVVYVVYSCAIIDKGLIGVIESYTVTYDVHVTFWDAYQQYMEGAIVNASKGWAFTIPENAAYVVYSCAIIDQQTIGVNESYSVTYGVHVTFWNASQEYISGVVVDSDSGWMFVIPAGAAYAVYSCGTIDKGTIEIFGDQSHMYKYIFTN